MIEEHCGNCRHKKKVCLHCKSSDCIIGKPCEYCSKNYLSQWRQT